MTHSTYFSSFLFRTLIILTYLFPAWAKEGTREVVIRPAVYPHALRNPLKGFRPDTSPRAFKHEYATLTRCYLRWNELENDETDTIDRIKEVCDEKWMDIEKHNIKVIPRVYLDWDEKKGNEYWPADMQTGDYSSEQFKRRVIRLVQRLGQCWDNDPRVAWVQLGIIGHWGEHHNPSPNGEMQKLLGDAFTGAFRNKKVTVRHPWEFTDYEFGIYWDSWAHIQQVQSHGKGIEELNNNLGRWKICPIGGECAYNWGRYGQQPGDHPNDTLRDPNHLDWLLYTIRWLHCSNLGWVASYDAGDPQVRQGAEQVQKTFGYRFIVDEVRFPAELFTGQTFTVTFSVRNVGSAPFYYNWPIEISLLDPKSKEVVWRDIFRKIDICSWLPGDKWHRDRHLYEVKPKLYQVSGSFVLSPSVSQGRYILALAILDPAGMVPSVRFAIENYFKGGRHPIGLVGVGKTVPEPVLDPASYDDPAEDRILQYVLDSRYNLAESSELPLSLQEAAAVGNVNMVRSLIQEGIGVDSRDDSLTKTALQLAAINGHKDVVELLLTKGAKIDAQQDWPGGTALHYAAEKGHRKIVELLIVRGADVNAERGYPAGDTPLHSVVMSGYKEVAELLIENGADVNAKNNEGQTPVDAALKLNRKDIVELLLARGAEISSIHAAVRTGDLARVKTFLEHGADVNEKNKSGVTPLRVATDEGRKVIAEWLISKGAQVDAKDKWGYTPLYDAARAGEIEMLEFLIAKGADVNVKDNHNITPLHEALSNNHKDVVVLLIDKGADLNARARWGYTPVYYAVWSGSKEMVELLVEEGADVNVKDEWALTPLHHASSLGNKDIIELLLAKGADVNAKDEWALTPLHNASSLGNKDIIELLLAKGADVNAKDEWVWTPLHYACWKNRGYTAELLLAKGADLNAREEKGKTPLSVAREEGHTEIVELLRKHGAKEDKLPQSTSKE